MRILYAGTGYKPAYRLGGPIVSVSATAEMLVRKGHEVVVVSTNANNDQELDVPVGVPVDVDGVQVWYFRRQEPLRRFLPFVPYLSRSIGFMYAPEMRAALDRLVPDVDLVHTQGPFVYPSYAAAHAAKRYRKPLLYSQRGSFDEERLRFRSMKKKLYIAAVEKPIMRYAASLVALTEAERASYRALGVNTPIAIVTNGIDIPGPRSRAVERVLTRFGIANDALMILFLGRLHPIKGADKLLEAFLRVMHDFPDAVLMIAGPDEWGLEKRWRAHVVDGDRVIFPGMIGGEEKADVLARADLFCLPSVAEGFSIAVLEALASSTAVMLSPACHFPEVEGAKAGVVVDADIERMVAVMRELLGDPVRLRAMGEAGRRLVSEHYSWDLVTDRLIELYTEAVGQRARTESR
ncbi:MAG TPA: glycosyltransferase [Thermoanaerobaculia bacterium]|jgi:glycosyltransferase involved in cell wall biosynthesis|nr:glycosyltransferase [Thermoanaerobaculia bacterium]